ncbi:hypothetical protein [Deinococcus sp.]|uniref:hypothetical protein n=1 Tax=Deinococcus sp. TaxID=47478 RepID=UPI0025E1AE03|nr:hypothetical protein [Deinococcus sp.]
MNRLVLIGSLLLGTAMLTACSGGGITDTALKPGPVTPVPSGEPPAEPKLASLSISGSVVIPRAPNTSKDTPWNGGAGQITAILAVTKTEVLSTALSATGAFALNLNETVDDSKLGADSLALLFKSYCPAGFKLTASNPGARDALAYLEVKSASINEQLLNANSVITLATASAPALQVLKVGFITYSNAANTITGNQSCLFENKTIAESADVSLVKGWNSLVLTFTGPALSGASGENTITLSNGASLDRWATYVRLN